MSKCFCHLTIGGESYEVKDAKARNDIENLAGRVDNLEDQETPSTDNSELIQKVNEIEQTVDAQASQLSNLSGQVVEVNQGLELLQGDIQNVSNELQNTQVELEKLKNGNSTSASSPYIEFDSPILNDLNNVKQFLGISALDESNFEKNFAVLNSPFIRVDVYDWEEEETITAYIQFKHIVFSCADGILYVYLHVNYVKNDWILQEEIFPLEYNVNTLKLTGEFIGHSINEFYITPSAMGPDILLLKEQ